MAPRAFPEPLFIDKTKTSTPATNQESLKRTLSGIGQGLFVAREKFQDFLRPVPTTEQLQQERKQTLIPEEAQKIKTEKSKEAGVVPIGGDRYLDPFGTIGTLGNVARNVTSKVLKNLQAEVKSPTVSRQAIENIVSRSGVRQAEKDLVRSTLDEIGGNKVPVNDLINRVESKLLPLRVGGQSAGRYENITLPDDVRGPVANYQEHVYESPIKTSAGDVHFGADRGALPGEEGAGFPNYFAHTRVEDLPVGETKVLGRDVSGNPIYDLADQSDGSGGTRRVIEIQSDLFQKGNLEVSVEIGGPKKLKAMRALRNLMPEGTSDARAYSAIKTARPDIIEELGVKNLDEFKQAVKGGEDAILGSAEYKKLEPYRNTWHERVIREEVKRAAQDGKTKLQFPTGETAMKIEGLGESTQWRSAGNGHILKPNELKVGAEVNSNGQSDWIITDVLGYGKFKAVPKRVMDEIDAGTTALDKDTLASVAETFDISGKVDTDNPIYRFYEKEVGKYLKNRHNARRITDPQGVEWYEIDIPKGAGRQPVEAFGAAGLFNMREDEEKPRLFGRNSTPPVLE